MWMSQAELVITIGAKGIYDQIHSHTKVVQINPKPTRFDSVANLVIRKKADEVFGALQ